MIKTSKVRKLDGIKTWSLQAGETCPGSIVNGNVLPVCKGCYAKGGCYRFKATKAVRAYNKKDWQRDDFVADFVNHIKNDKFFRWFDSGDVYCIGLARKIKEIIKLTPNTNHWLPTKSHNVSSILPILEEIKLLPNVMVRYSAPNIDGKYSDNHGATCTPNIDATDAKICYAYTDENGNKCNGCRDCWNKNIPVIAYVAHGQKMKKILKETK